MADLEVKQVNTLPKNSVVLSDYLLAIGTTEEYQAKMQDIIVAGLNNYKAKLITGYPTNVSVVEALNYVYNLQRDTSTATGLANVQALLGTTRPASPLTSTTVSQAVNEIQSNLTSHINSYNDAVSAIWAKLGSGTLDIGTSAISAINQLNTLYSNHTEQQNRDIADINSTLSSHAGSIGSLSDKVGNTTLTTTDKTVSGAINELKSSVDSAWTKIGTSNLTTTATNISAAINELKSAIDNINTDIGNIDIETDTTLSVQGKPADAAAVGRKFNEFATSVANAEGVVTRMGELETQFSDLESAVDNYGNGLIIDVDDGKLYLTHNGTAVGDGVEVSTSGGGGGLSFDSGYVASGNADDGEDPEASYLHLTMNGEDISGFTPFIIPAGGGGGSAASATLLVFRKVTSYKTSVLKTSGTAPISFNITAKDSATGDPVEGSVTLQIKNQVSGLLYTTLVLDQGDNTVDVFNYLNDGSNKLQFVFSFEGDSGTVTLTKSYEIIIETFSLSWNIENETMATSSDLTIYLSQSGSGSKTLYITVDGRQYASRNVTVSNSTESFNVSLSVGVHTIKAYGTMVTNGLILNSQELSVVVAKTSSTNRAILLAVNFEEDEVSQYTTLHIPYTVVNPASSTTLVQFLVNNDLIEEQTATQAQGSFDYRVSQTGTVTISLIADTAEWEKTIEVSALSSEVQEVSAGLVFKLDPNEITNLDDFYNNGVTLSTNSDFDYTNGGIQLDEEGYRCIKVMKGDRLTVDYNLFGSSVNANGMNFKIIYKVVNPSNINAKAISCYSGGTNADPYNNGVGLVISANNARLDTRELKGASGFGQDMCENYKVELEYNIYHTTNSMTPGVPSNMILMLEKGSVAYGNVFNGSVLQTPSVPITIGSDDCDVYLYLIRVYNRELNKSEIQQNFVFDGGDALEINRRLNRNQIYDGNGNIDPQAVARQNPDLRVLVWSSDGCSTAKIGKGDDKYGTLRQIFVNGGAEHNWIAGSNEHPVRMGCQGTSSLDYITAGANFDFDMKNTTFVYDDPSVTPTTKYAMTSNSIPVNYFNYKTNTASQEHTNNTCIAEWFNEFQPHIRQARANNPKVRDTVEGHPCVLFFHNTSNNTVYMDGGSQVKPVSPGATVFYGLGDFNNSKKNDEVFGHNATDDQYCVEIKNNSAPPCRFILTSTDDGGLTSEVSIEGNEWDNYYEFRYIDDSIDEEEARQNWRDFVYWVDSLDADRADGTSLPSEERAKTYYSVAEKRNKKFTTKTRDYCISRWRAEFGDHAVLDSVFFHQLMTEALTMMDNRAKNTFWGWSAVDQKWHINFDYDNDTALGINNEGRFAFPYGKVETDAGVFNASDSVIFKMNLLAFGDDESIPFGSNGHNGAMSNLFVRLENNDAFDLEELADRMDAKQAKIPEVLWMEDAWMKDVIPYTYGYDRYIKEMTTGRKRLQRRYWCKFQKLFISSFHMGKYFTGSGNTVVMRSCMPQFGDDLDDNTRAAFETTVEAVPPKARFYLTPYHDMWAAVKGTAGVVSRKKILAGQTDYIDFGNQNYSDQECSIYGGAYMLNFGDESNGGLAPLYISSFEVPPNNKITNLCLGSKVPGYYNIASKTVSDISAFPGVAGLNNCKNLENMNVGGFVTYSGSVDLTSLKHVREFYSENSVLGSVDFADGGRLVRANLNAVRGFTAKNLNYLEEFTLQSYDNLTDLKVDNTPFIDTLNIVKNSTGLQVVRLVGINWDTDKTVYDILMRLNGSDIGGVNDSGVVTNRRVITGAVHFDKISTAKLNELNAAYRNEITFSTDTTLATYTIRFVNYDNTLLYEENVDSGDDIIDPYPVYGGTKLIDVPTKPPQGDVAYVFSGWNPTLGKASRSMTVVAQYAETERYCTVVFNDADGNALETYTVAAGGSTYYRGSDLYKDGFIWIGWDQDTSRVVSDMVVNPAFIVPQLPSSIKDLSNTVDYPYAYSDDETDKMAYTKAEIYSIFYYDRAEQYGFRDGVKMKMVTTSSVRAGVITDTTIVWEYIGKGRYQYADGSEGASHGELITIGILNQTRRMNSLSSNTGGWDRCELRSWCNNSFYRSLDPFWRNLIKPAYTLASAGNLSPEILTSVDYVKIPSQAEVRMNTTDVPYKDEVWSGSPSKAYSIFTDNVSRQARLANNTTATGDWWLRSPQSNSTSYYWYIRAGGDESTNNWTPQATSYHYIRLVVSL